MLLLNGTTSQVKLPVIQQQIMNNTPVSKTAGQEKVLKYYYAPSTYFNKYV